MFVTLLKNIFTAMNKNPQSYGSMLTEKPHQKLKLEIFTERTQVDGTLLQTMTLIRQQLYKISSPLCTQLNQVEI